MPRFTNSSLFGHVTSYERNSGHNKRVMLYLPRTWFLRSRWVVQQSTVGAKEGPIDDERLWVPSTWIPEIKKKKNTEVVRTQSLR